MYAEMGDIVWVLGKTGGRKIDLASGKQFASFSD
jgi:hypothetical protein